MNNRHRQSNRAVHMASKSLDRWTSSLLLPYEEIKQKIVDVFRSIADYAETMPGKVIIQAAVAVAKEREAQNDG